ncbi:MAG: Cro/CI family transcriptional regulator [Gammaproteobacteria bacterium]
MDQIDALISYFGSKNKLAAALGVTPPAISQWKDFIPKGRAYQIEVLTNGKFKAQELARRNKLQINLS